LKEFKMPSSNKQKYDNDADSFLSDVGGSNSWSDDGETTASGNENFFDGMINSLANALNLPFEIPSKESRNDDHDDDYDDDATNGSTGDRTFNGSTVLSSRNNKPGNSLAGKKKPNYFNVSHKSDLNKRMEQMRMHNTTTTFSLETRDILSVNSSESDAYSSVGSSSLYSFEYYSSSFDSDADSKKARGVDMNDTIGAGGGKRVEYDSAMAQLYRAIDTKCWDVASKWLKTNPIMANYWVYRQHEKTGDVVWMFLPLHAACFSSAPTALVRELLAVYPVSASTPAPGEKLPVHIACETAACPETVVCLVNAYPEALYHVDSSGNTPLQLSVFSMSGKNRSKVMKILTNAAAGKMASPKKMKFRNLLST
jgi:hypothetical protein